MLLTEQYATSVASANSAYKALKNAYIGFIAFCVLSFTIIAIPFIFIFNKKRKEQTLAFVGAVGQVYYLESVFKQQNTDLPKVDKTFNDKILRKKYPEIFA